MAFVEIPILKAAYQCGIYISNPNRVEVEVNCPFCNDRKKHLSLNTIKNQFRCNRCNESGNSVTLYAKLRNVDNMTAYAELTEGTALHAVKFEKRNLPGPQQSKIKSLAKRHDVYYDMLLMLNLSKQHMANLLERGLDRATIERNMYRSMPHKYSERYYDLARELAKAHNLVGIPGFYQENGQWRFVQSEGMIIPICNHHGYIQGLQIRLNNESNRKYRWFSSRNYENGSKAEPWIHVANWNNHKTVYITEGALKAEVASFLMEGVCIIGLAGVNCVNGLSELLMELGVNEAIECFDMDKTTNLHVIDSLSILKSKVAQAGSKYHSAQWNPLYKGLDDYYLALQKGRTVAA